MREPGYYFTKMDTSSEWEISYWDGQWWNTFIGRYRNGVFDIVGDKINMPD